MVEYVEQKRLVKLELGGKLASDLPNTVDELQENRRSVVGRFRRRVLKVSDSMGKLVSEAEPLLFNQHLEALQRPVVGIQEEHGKRRQLGGPVPTVGTVDNDGKA